MPITISTGLMKYRNQNGTYEDINAVSYEAGVTTHICSSSEYNATTRIPTVQNPEENIFYLVPAENGTSPDMFVEWIYANNAWERFGNVTLDIPVEDVQVNGTSIVNNGVANIPNGSTSNYGVIKVGSGLRISSENKLVPDTAGASTIKAGTNTYSPITASNQHASVFYGLAKAAGDSTQSSSNNAVGTYTSEAKTAIRSMIGAAGSSDIPSVPVQDVQVNGTSVLSNGIADIPKGGNTNYGVTINASSAYIKSGDGIYYHISPTRQHESVFYGLAKAAGDNTQSASDNAVGTYTSEAKTAIQTMLDIPANDDVLIKSPTFGTPEVIVDTTTLSFHKDGDNEWYCTDENPIQGFTQSNFKYDCIYKVEWDGIEYPEEISASYEKVHYNNGAVNGFYEWGAIGNVEFLGNANCYKSVAPFAIAYDYYRNSNEVQIFTEDASASHTIKITKIPFSKTEQKEQFYNDMLYNVPLIRKGTGEHSIAVGSAIDASGDESFAEGMATVASGMNSHAEGRVSVASGGGSHAEGGSTIASGLYAHAEGYLTTASDQYTHAEGAGTKASIPYSHAEGYNTQASGWVSHAEGTRSIANGTTSHAEGIDTVADSDFTHAEGYHTYAGANSVHVQGRYNVKENYESFSNWVANTEYSVGDYVNRIDSIGDIVCYKCKEANNDATFNSSKWESNPLLTYADIVGNGTDEEHRSNAFALTWDGDGKYAGHVYVGANANSSGGTMLPEDVQVNGTSVVSNGVANIPIADATNPGTVIIANGNGLAITNGILSVNMANSSAIKTGTNTNTFLRPSTQDESTFYGLAKAAGDTTQSQSSNAVGTYTTEAKAAIQSMFNVPSKTDTILDTTLSRGRKENTTVGTSSFAFGDNVQASGLVSHAEGRGTTATGELAHAEGNYAKAYGFASHAEGNYTEASGNSSHVEGYGTVASGELSHAEGSQTAAIGPHSHAEGHNNYRLSTNAYEINDQQYNLNYGAVGTADHSEGYDTIADSTLGGTLNYSYAAHAEGVGTIAVANAQHAQGKWNAPDTNFADVVGNGTENARSNAYALTWTGNGKYAGHVYVGANADSSGGTMLPEDIQVNGTSVVSNGVANIPVASGIAYGAVKVGNGNVYGVEINSEGVLQTNTAGESTIKSGTASKSIIAPIRQHIATFYGLAKAAGDSTQASSNNAVGTYTTEAKAAIHTMLGINPASIAAQVEIPLIETVSGTTPSITGQPNTRYNCGEVSTISITPPVSGSIDVFFESGSTAAVLTVPNTVKWPEWFDASSLEANTVYEILITDGVYGSVMTWAA